MAEVEVNQETGHIQVKRVCAQDMGQVINRDQVADGRMYDDGYDYSLTKFISKGG
jgi:hypothetical protein